jgi:hypothetical protein
VLHERYRQADKDTIVNDVAIEAAQPFTAPRRFQREYKRQDFRQWTEEKQVCGGNDDFQTVVGGRLLVAPVPTPPAAGAAPATAP